MLEALTFARTCIILSVVWAILFFCFALLPEAYMAAYGIDADGAAMTLARRSAPVLLGLTWLCWGMRVLETRDLRRVVLWANALIFVSVAVSGVTAYAVGAAGGGILIAAAAETVAAVLLMMIAARQT